MTPYAAGEQEPYLWAGAFSAQPSSGSVLAHLIDVRTAAVQVLLRAEEPYTGGETAALPLARTNGGLWLVPVAAMEDPWGGMRRSYALAAPETVFAGQRGAAVYPDADAARCNGMIFGRGGALRRQYADDGGLWSFPHRPLFFLSFRCLALCLVV